MKSIFKLSICAKKMEFSQLIIYFHRHLQIFSAKRARIVRYFGVIDFRYLNIVCIHNHPLLVVRLLFLNFRIWNDIKDSIENSKLNVVLYIPMVAHERRPEKIARKQWWIVLVCSHWTYVTTFIVFNSNVARTCTFLSKIKLNDDVFRLHRYTLYACIYTQTWQVQKKPRENWMNK